MCDLGDFIKALSDGGVGSDRLDPFLNCVQVVKNVVSPKFRKIAKNFEYCVIGFPKMAI